MNNFMAAGILIMAMTVPTTIPSGIDQFLVTEAVEEETLDDIYIIPKESLELLALVVMSEAEGESELGKRLVVDTVLNRVDSEYFPNSIRSVVYQDGASSSISDGRIGKCYVTDENFRIAEEEVEKRTNSEVIFFRTERYSIYGVPLFNEGHHYFSGM